MKTIQYCYDPRAELICCALYNTKQKEKGVQFFWGDELEEYLIDWMPNTLVAHNAKFDMMFLKAQFPDLNWHKSKFLCSMNMAQCIYHPAHSGVSLVSLDKLAKHFFNVGKFLDVKQFDGLGLDEIRSDAFLEAEMITYVVRDTGLCARLFKKFRDMVPTVQQQVIQWALHVYLNPKVATHDGSVEKLRLEVEANRDKLREKLEALVHVQSFVIAKYQEANQLSKTGRKRKERPLNLTQVLKSRPMFKELLEHCNYDVPEKPSPSNRLNMIPQLAKTDPFIMDNENMDTELGDLIRCRLAYSSNLELTRCETWQAIKKISPFYHYSVTPSGAFTHRITGNDSGGANPLNLPRKSILRKAIRPASSKFTFAGFDLSGLELRISRFVANDKPAIKIINAGGDLYINFICAAKGIDEVEFTKKYLAGDTEADQTRFIGKVGSLQIQYGSSGRRLHQMFRQMGVDISEEECTDIVNYFRKIQHPAVPHAWNAMATMLMDVAQEGELIYNGEDIRRVLNIPGEPVLGGGWRWPSGVVLRFPKLTKRQNHGGYGTNYIYKPAWPIDKTEKSIYPSAFFQAHIQSLANEVIMDIRTRLIQAGYYVAMECYDELTQVIHKTKATEETRTHIRSIAEAPLSWWPEGPPLEAEVKFGDTYYDAK